jgi:co-chaperonin GroES (HSP10)
MNAIQDKIIVEAPLSQGTTTTPSGLFVPSVSEQAQYIKSAVVAAGDKATDAGIAPGVTVHFNRLAAPKIMVQGKEFYVLRLDDVLAVE